MSHVAPHRWADALAGKLGETELAAMARHAEGCPRCASARDRIGRATQTFQGIRTQSPPEVAWDAIRARVHWSVSSERRARLRTSGRGFAIVAWGAITATGLAIGLASGPAPIPPWHAAAPIAAVEPRPIAPVAPTALAGLVSRLAGDVMIDGIRPGDAFDRAIGVGTILATADGRIDVQFGDASAFALGPRSTLELRKFDADTIELAVEGTVDVEVAPRTRGQRFIVIAGDQAVEVRGTQFRVSHDAGATRVACRHGLVAVRDRGGELEVGAARKVEVRGPIDAARVVALSTDELAQLAQATPVTVPLWTDSDGLARSSSPLEIATIGKRDVRLDGVELGEAPLRVRVMPGRHTVEATDSAGRYRRAGWVHVGADHPARLEVMTTVDEAAPTRGVALRKQQFHAGIDRKRLGRCTRDITKQGLTAHALIDISVDTAGNVGALNIIDSDVHGETESCVKEVLADVRFGAGPAATWRETLDPL